MVIHDKDMSTTKVYNCSVDGNDYQISVAGYISRHGMAECYIHDLTNRQIYHSEGRLELNNHVITTYWQGMEYNDRLARYVSNKELVIKIE